MTEKQKKQYVRIFKGEYKEQIPKLVKSGLEIATISDIMELKLRGELSFAEEHDSVSGIAYAGDNKDKFKIIPYSHTLSKINTDTPLHENRVVKTTTEEYEEIRVPEFSTHNMILKQEMTQERVLEHPGWNALVPKKLLEEYSEQVFRIAKNEYGKSTAMAFFLPDESMQKIPCIYPFSLDGMDKLDLSAICFCSDVSEGGKVVGDLYSRLVGISELPLYSPPKQNVKRI